MLDVVCHVSGSVDDLMVYDVISLLPITRNLTSALTTNNTSFLPSFQLWLENHNSFLPFSQLSENTNFADKRDGNLME